MITIKIRLLLFLSNLTGNCCVSHTYCQKQEQINYFSWKQCRQINPMLITGIKCTHLIFINFILRYKKRYQIDLYFLYKIFSYLRFISTLFYNPSKSIFYCAKIKQFCKTPFAFYRFLLTFDSFCQYLVCCYVGLIVYLVFQIKKNSFYLFLFLFINHRIKRVCTNDN